MNSSSISSPAIAARPSAQAGADRRGGPSAAVAFEGVSRSYGQVLALDGVDLVIPGGSTVALLGPNGAGKSTAIGLMLGLLHPDRGTVGVLGLPPRDAVEAGRVGAMLQVGGLPVGVTVGEIVDFTRRLYPHPMTLERALALSGMTAFRRRRTEDLSGGETQRLRFALAIAGDPELVFLDEPTVAMDVESRRGFWAEMRQFAAEGRTVLFATHYLEEADQVADRIVVLDRGRVVADGTAGSLKAGVAGRTIRFTLPYPDPAVLGALPGVTACDLHGDDVTLRSSDTDATLRAIYAGDLPILDLEVTGADLETAFLALTRNDD
ncbi:MAG TPA: ABC transporter ATP-binding protein [Candidatus Limnocylindrales bacterium]